MKSKDIERVVREYAAEHGCLCGWGQFEYLASRFAGYDSRQNTLVDCAIRLHYMIPTGPQSEPHGAGYEQEYTCSVCGSKAIFEEHELKMATYLKTITPLKPNVFSADQSRKFGWEYFGQEGGRCPDGSLKSIKPIAATAGDVAS